MNDVATAADRAFNPTLLCVDDEANILSALKRLFRPDGFRILTAPSGSVGLAILETEPVDLIISDMRMPEMSGAQFLEHARARWPQCVRILLTGYADVDSTIAAINKGEIHRYVAKPWDDQEMLRVVRGALERKRLEHENRRLAALVQRQNEELKQLNVGLEALVEQRTAESRSARDALSAANAKLQDGFLASIKLFSNLMELRGENEAGHSRRVANLAGRIAHKMGVRETEEQDILLAGLLHDIGKIGIAEATLAKSPNQLNADEMRQLRKHPERGEAALADVEQLREPARLLRSHHERFDGRGYPEGLVGRLIPLGARILAIANDFDALQIGTMTGVRMSHGDARAFIEKNAGTRYDPAIVPVFLELVGEAPADAASSHEAALPASELKPGMTLSRDLVTRKGEMLLAADHTLDPGLIRHIRGFEHRSGEHLSVYVRTATE